MNNEPRYRITIAHTYTDDSEKVKGLLNQFVEALHSYGYAIYTIENLTHGAVSFGPDFKTSEQLPSINLYILSPSFHKDSPSEAAALINKIHERKSNNTILLKDKSLELDKFEPSFKTLNWDENNQEGTAASVHEAILAITNTSTHGLDTGTESFGWSIGSRGEQVAAIQQMLKKTVAPELFADGDYGPATAEAVKVFQKNNKLEVTGEVDEQIFQRLDEEARKAELPPAETTFEPEAEQTSETEKQQANTNTTKPKASSSYFSKSRFTIRDGIEPVLGVKTVAAEVADLIRNLKTKDLGKMVGVFGNWGRGKTFLVEQVWKVLEEDKTQPFIRVNFHAWKFQDTHASWAYLYEAFARKYFSKDKNKNWFENFFLDFGRRFNLNILRHGFWPLIRLGISIGTVVLFAWLANQEKETEQISKVFWMLLSTAGAANSIRLVIRFFKEHKIKEKATEVFKVYFEKPSFKDLLGVQSEIQNELRNLLECWLPEKNGEPEKQILLFVDDIDRCSEDRIIQIIDALRVMLDDEQISRRVIVITAIDERVLRRAIKWKYRELLGADKKLMNDVKAWEETSRQITSEYMDKLFLSGIKLGTLTEAERIEIYQQFSNGKVQTKEITTEKPETPEPEVKTETPAEKEPYRKPMESVDPLVLTKPIDQSNNQNPTPTAEKKTATVPAQTPKPETSFELAFDENEFLVNMIREVHDVTPRQIRIFYYRYMLARNLLTVALTQSKTETQYEPGYRNQLLARLLQHYTGLRSNEELLNDRKILNLREPKIADTTIATLIKDEDPQLINEIMEALEMVIAY